MPTPQEEIKARLDLIDLVREYVPIVQVGANWKARCPFHDEKSASFMVSQPKQIWHCFGCSEGGDHFSFVMKIENIEFPEALELLAKKVGVELPKRMNVVSTNQKESVRAVLQIAQQFFSDALRPSFAKASEGRPSGGDAAWEYLTITRALTEKTIQEFGLGFAPSSWDALTNAFLTQGCAAADILASGLVVERSEQQGKSRGTPFYDRFRGRIMFPVYDARGEIVGFGGRLVEGATLTLNRKSIVEEPKYLNTPQTILYDKRSLLYGLDKAKQGIRVQDSIIVLEGYMDVIASHQAGVENVVATCGTALTLQHLQLMKRHAPTVILAFDMDAAGMNASKRGIDLLLNSELKIGMLRIPDGFGKDADECIRKDPELWKKLTSTFRSFLEVLWERMTQGKALSSLAVQEQVAKDFVPFVAKAGSAVERAYWVKIMSNAFGYPQETIKEWIRAAGQKISAPPPPSGGKGTLSVPTLDTEQAFVGLLMVMDRAVADTVVLAVEPNMFNNNEHAQWFLGWKFGNAGQPQPEDSVIASWLTHIIAATEVLYGNLEEEKRVEELEHLTRSIRSRFFQQELQQVQKELRDLEYGSSSASEESVQRIQELLERAQKITQQLS